MLSAQHADLGVQMALFKGFLNIPHIPLPFGHSVDTNEATMDPTPENSVLAGSVPSQRDMYVKPQWASFPVPNA